LSFKEKYGPCALVAGASEGMGLAFAEKIASNGINLVLVARREEKLKQATEVLQTQYSIEVKYLPLDLSEEASFEKIFSFTASLEIGLLVYNAAVSSINWFVEEKIEVHREMITVNCIGPALLTHHYGNKMKILKKGGIILMSSMGGLQGLPGISHYAATKAYNMILAEGLWYEMQDYGVDVLGCIAGATSTKNYLDSRPKNISIFAPPVQTPEQVVDEAFKNLGKKPSIVTGKWNRLASFFVHRLSSRKKAVSLMGKSTREMYTHFLK